MIGRTSKLSIKRQCTLLGLPRSTAYYQPVEISDADHTLMRLIDELHLQYPFAGSCMLRDLLRQGGHKIGRRHVRTLMRKMGNLHAYASMDDAKAHLKEYLEFYNSIRPHRSLDGRTPDAVYYEDAGAERHAA